MLERPVRKIQSDDVLSPADPAPPTAAAAPHPLYPTATPAPAPDAAPSAGDEITLRDLLDRLRRGKWLILAVLLASLAAAMAWLRLEPPDYTATMIVAPARGDIGALAGLASRLEDYAAFATLGSVPTDFRAVSSIERYEQLLTSVELAERLQREHGFLQRLMPELWDAERQTWRPPPGPLPAARRAVIGFFGHPGWTPPTAATLATYLDDEVVLKGFRATHMRQVEFDHPDPVLAVELLEALHAGADAILREDAAAEVADQVAYLEREIAAAENPARRAALEGMLAEQYRAQAMLEGGLLAPVELVSKPSASDEPTSPGPALVLALATLGGLSLGAFLALLVPVLRGRGAAVNRG